MRSKIIKSMTMLEFSRVIPFVIVTSIIGVLGIVLFLAAYHEFHQLGYLITRHLPVVFALILGADLAARDQEQKTLISISALPVASLDIWVIRSVVRLSMAMILWLIMSGFFVLQSDIQILKTDLIYQDHDYTAVAVPILIFYSFFTSVFCSLFSRETLSSIGWSAAILVGGSTLSSIYGQKHLALCLICLTVIFAVASLYIFTSRKQWVIQSQKPALFFVLCTSLLVIILL